MAKIKILRCAAFLLIVILLLAGLCDLFEHEEDLYYVSRFHTYRTLSRNTVDAVYFGTSGVDRSWIAAKAYSEYGMTVYPLSTDSMASWLYINMIKEAQAGQDPQLFIFDIRAFCQDNDLNNTEVRARRALEAMKPFTANWFNTVGNTMDTFRSINSSADTDPISYIFSFVKYHSKWSEDGFSIDANLKKADDEYLGFFMKDTASIRCAIQDDIIYDEDLTSPLDPVSEEALYELISYIRDNDINALFVDAPHIVNEKEISRTNTVLNILDEHGMSYIAYNIPSVIDASGMNINTDEDFYDKAHLNYYGAEKFTSALSAYINDNYHLPDRRRDENVKKYWDDAYPAILNTIETFEKAQD